MKNKILSPIVLLTCLALFTVKEGVAQNNPNPAPPDCVVFLNNLTTAQSVPSGNGFDSRFIGCSSWTLQYQSVGFTGLTLTFQSSVGSVTPTAFTTYTGTVVAGAVMMTSTTGEISTFSNGTTTTPWVRVNLSGLTGTGTLNGVLYGYKTGYTGGSGGGGGGGGCVGTLGTPCVVNVSQYGSTSVVNGGLAGTPGVGGTTAVGGAATNPVQSGYRDSVGNVLADYGFPQQNQITLTTGTDVVIVAGVSATKTYVGSLSFAADSGQTVTIQQGTGTTCLTNTLVLAGPYPLTTALALDFDSKNSLHTTINARDLCVHFGGSVTAGGVVVYGTH